MNGAAEGAVAVAGGLRWQPVSAAEWTSWVRGFQSGELHLWLLARDREPSARALIAAYAGLAPAALHLDYEQHGKPVMADRTLAFNLSHSGGAILLGLAQHARVGVDLEHPRRIERRQALLARCFTAAERQRIAAAEDAALLRYWTAKEALVKAIGRGLGYGLARIELAEAPDGALRISTLEGPAGPAAAWQLHIGRVEPEAYYAVAYDGPPRRLRAFRLQSEATRP